MAKPQKENGYTPIANEILDQIVKLSLNSTQLKILIVVWRFTYGFSRKEHELSLNFISKATNVSKRYVSSEVSKLLEMKILSVLKESTYTNPRIISFNKNYEQWDSRRIVLLVNDCSTVEQMNNTTVEELFNSPVEELFYQENKYKTNNKTIYPPIFEKFYSEYPNAVRKNSTYANWNKALKKYCVNDLMLACQNYKAKVETDGTLKKYIKNSPNFLSMKEKFFVDYIDYEEEDTGHGVILPGGGIML